MARDEAYQKAEEKIEEARRTGATELNLSCGYGADDSEKLTELPESLGQLTQLQMLRVDWNKVRSIPEWIGGLGELHDLRFYENDVTTLPDSLRNLKRLSTLVLMENPKLGIPDEITRKYQTGAQEILQYYFSTRGEQGRALREVKLIVVGRGGAGKTSLVRRLGGNKLNPRESETHGINISPL